MNLALIAENIGDGKIVSDIYSGNTKCKCGKSLKFEELNLGGFGTSLSCSCGSRFWIAEEEDGLKDLLVYEGYDCIIDDHFLIVKQRVFSEITWNKKKLFTKKLREENEYLYIDFESKILVFFDGCGKKLKDGGQLFFNSISIDDMHNISQWIHIFCRRKCIYPNYGQILDKLTSSYNTVNYENMLKKILQESYIESFFKNGLAYLFDYNFLINVAKLESSIVINKYATTCKEILEVPKKIVDYIKQNKMETTAIIALQNFFKQNNYNDFKNLILDKDSVFEISNLDQLDILLNYGYSAYKLNIYALEIMKEEKLSRKDFLTYLIDSVRMSRTSSLKFKFYAKRLKERHDKLASEYKLIKNEVINKKILQVHRDTVIKQYGKEYIALVPSSAQDFEEEAQNQRNCVLSYTDAVANGEALIVFVRYKDDLKKSYITLEIRNNRIVQAKKFANQPINSEDRKYLECLAKANRWLL